MNTDTKKCSLCQQKSIASHGNARFCADCRVIQKRVSQKKYVEANRDSINARRREARGWE